MSSILYKTASGVCTITLSKPDSSNAVDEAMLHDLSQALETAYNDKDARTIVLTGRGSTFCAGVNLSREYAAIDSEPVANFILETVNPLIAGMRRAPKPIIVAVNGPAVGFGMALALAGDIVIAAHSASFTLGFVNVGAALDGGTSLLTGLFIGGARARAMALLGDRIEAQSAQDWGLIWKAVDDDDLMPEVEKTAQRLCCSSANSIEIIKSQLADAQESQLSSVLEKEAMKQGSAFSTPDFQEALRAFKQGRKPGFSV